MHHARRITAGLFLVTAAAVTLQTTSAQAAQAGGSCPLPRFGPGSQYHPVIDRSSFSPGITNPWLPMRPGTTMIYTGRKDGEAALDVVTVSARTRQVDGVRTRVVEDRLFLAGRLRERTSDYYAQDACGNVWYFGEDTAELDRRGRVTDRSGSFHAGIDGAQPGVFMQADPTLNHRFRQEWSPGEAEDTFRVVDRSDAVAVPYGRFGAALKTEETTALEPGVVDEKHYVRGIGDVEEHSVRGADEKLVLVDVLR